uniref:Uncharacterized protein n=1 Tax=viral metagenome TaxID=1070528 RepID=A0A6C0ICI7_9ZZZZ
MKSVFYLRLVQQDAFPLGTAECYYLVQTYNLYPCAKSETSMGTANLQSWVYTGGYGIGTMNINPDEKSPFFLTAFGQYPSLSTGGYDFGLQHDTIGVIGGNNILTGKATVVVVSCPKDTYKLTLEYTVVENWGPTQYTHQNFLFKNRQAYVNQVNPNDPRSIYRLGQYDMYSLATGTLVGKIYYQVYGDSLTNTGIGYEVLSMDDSIFFANIQASYTDILSPTTKLKNVQGCIAGGQRFVSYINYGNFYYNLFPRTTDVAMGFYYNTTSSLQPLVTHTIPVLFTDKQTQVFVISSGGNPQSVIRLGVFSMLNPETKQRVGSAYFQTYVLSETDGIGFTMYQFENGGLLFGSYLTTLTNPFDPQSISSPEVSITCTSGAPFQDTNWGYARSVNLSETDRLTTFILGINTSTPL